jgi:predicted nucleotidyltransferase
LDQIQTGKVGALADTERKGELERIKEAKDPLTRRLLLMGLLTRVLESKNIKPVIVGGQAVEFYTAGGYATGDIDIVSPGQDEINKVLKELGFTKEGRHWFSEELDILVEVPSSTLTAAQYEKITTVEIDELKVFLIGIEDLIIDRLNASVHWKSADDRVWAKELVLLYKDEIDWEYLEKRASEEKISGAVKELKREMV